jgi:hypothetical protein
MSSNLQTDVRPPTWARIFIDLSAVAIVIAIGTWAAVSGHQQSRGVAGTGMESPRTLSPCTLKSDGYLVGRLFGALDQTIVWRGAEMTCDGMMRPDNRGIRLVFASPEATDDQRLLFVIGIDGELDSLLHQEQKANITIIDEGTGRFFSTSGQDRCWTTVRAMEKHDDGYLPAYRVEGDLYCAGALPSLNGKGSVTLGDFRYSGRLSLDDS